MAADDLVLAAIASKLITPSTVTQTATPNNPPTQSVGLTAEQLNAIANAVRSGVETGLSNLQLPAINVAPPEVNVAPPQVNVPPAQVQLPENLQVSFTDEEFARFAAAIKQAEVTPSSRQVQNRFLQIANTAGTTINTLAGGAPNGSYPNMVLVNSIQFTENVVLIGIVLSVSMLNTGTEPMGVYAAKVSSSLVNLSPGADASQRTTDIYLSLLTHNNSTGVTNAPASRTSSIAFSPGAAPVRFKSNEQIGIYACSQNIATALLAADLSVYYLPEDMTAQNAIGG